MSAPGDPGRRDRRVYDVHASSLTSRSPDALHRSVIDSPGLAAIEARKPPGGLHDVDARPIRKGRPGKPVEFGYKAQLVDNADAVILDHSIEVGNPYDAPNWRQRSNGSPAEPDTRHAGIVRLVIGAAEVDNLGVDTPEGDHHGRGVVQGPPVSGGGHGKPLRPFPYATL